MNTHAYLLYTQRAVNPTQKHTYPFQPLGNSTSRILARTTTCGSERALGGPGPATSVIYSGPTAHQTQPFCSPLQPDHVSLLV